MNNSNDFKSTTTSRAFAPISNDSTDSIIRTDKTLPGNPTTAELILALAVGALFLGTSLFMLVHQNVAFAHEASGYQSNKLVSTSQDVRRANPLTKAHSPTWSEGHAVLPDLSPIDHLNLTTPISAPAALK